MADDFKMTVKENNESISIELSGGFDRESAREVLRLLKNKHFQVSRFVIDTSRLKHANPAGLIQDEWSQWDQSLLA